MVAARLCKLFLGQSGYIRLKTGEKSSSSVLENRDVFLCRVVLLMLNANASKEKQAFRGLIDVKLLKGVFSPNA